MRRLRKVSLASCLLLSLGVSFCYAQSANPMYDFYDGLAAVIEQNMGNPDLCVAEAEKFISNNIGPILQAMQTAKQMAQGQQNSQMSAEEAQAMMQRMQETGVAEVMNQGMDAINRFMQALQSFAMQYPDHAEQISNILSKYAPQE